MCKRKENTLGGITLCQDKADLKESVETIFIQSRKNYGTRKIKKEREYQGVILSRRKIGKLMKH
ncbi:IS3 family transposase [Enterococcus sp. BWB1-3]|uniref:IS3 family transposase n=1 Tax=unclassified Enterococcus TaxID=2608891 RepID=UPI001923EA96|nr:IS3 family transposase [Enterococcus sp. BWB1-3]